MQQAMGGEWRWGGAEVVENLPALDVLPMVTEVEDDSQPNALIQQQIVSPSFPMIMTNAAGVNILTYMS
jgi:hypothetical protein